MNTTKILTIYFCLIISQLSPSCQTDTKEKKLNIFAAASLKDVLTETAEVYKKETGIKLSLNFASSGILARQIEQGAEVDFFFSANKDWISYTTEKNLLDKHSVLKLARNKMCIAVPKESHLQKLTQMDRSKFSSLFNGRLAIGNPTHVPSGKYAKEILEHHELWKDLEKSILPCKNARETLLMIEMREVDLGIVYLSDAKKSKKVRCIYEFAEKSSSPILYYSAHRSTSNSKLLDFQKFLNKTESKEIWEKHAFIVND